MKILNRTNPLIVFVYLSFTLFLTQSAPAASQSLSGMERAGATHSGSWAFGIGTGASYNPKNNETNSFQGNGIATKMFGRYYFGKIGLSATTGVLAGKISENAINRFMSDRSLPAERFDITRGNPLNGFLLFGPSFKFGNKIFVNADLQGGIFLNNQGAVNIRPKGENLSLYRFENTGKNIFPGFSGSISFNYPIGRTTQLFVNGDYLQSGSSVRVFDPKNGMDVPAKINRTTQVVVAGLGIKKVFDGARDRKNELANGERSHPVPTATSYNHHEEKSAQRLDMTVTTPRQSSENDANGIIFGVIYWEKEGTGIVTNEMIRNGKKEPAKSAPAISIAWRSIRTPPSESYNPWEMDNDESGTVLNPLFEAENIKNDNPLYGTEGRKGDNPLFEASRMKGDNPLVEGDNTATSNPLYSGNNITGADNNCNGVAGLSVALIDLSGGFVVARTKTESCGNFFFANVPEGNYSVQISGEMTIENKYDFNITNKEKQFYAGKITDGNLHLGIQISTGTGTVEQAVALQKTNARPDHPNDRISGNELNQSGIVWQRHSDHEVSPANRQAGQPIGGIIVKGGRNPGGQMKTTVTDNNGVFVFSGWEKGSYRVITETPYTVNTTIRASFSGSSPDGQTAGRSNAQDFNTTRSNRERGQFLTIPDSSGPQSPRPVKILFSIQQNGALTGNMNEKNSGSFDSGKSYFTINEDRTITGRLNAQDFNTCRSNRDNR